MIECHIDGKAAHPDTKSAVKLSYNNEYVTDSGEYSYELRFPTDIAANRDIFGTAGRYDTKPPRGEFERVELTADGTPCIVGKGRVTGFADGCILLQVTGGKAVLKHSERFAKVFIDRIPYPAIEPDQGFYRQADGTAFWRGGQAPLNLNKISYAGQRGKVGFFPTYAEGNGAYANVHVPMKANPTPYSSGNIAQLYNPAPQPFLIYTIECVLRHFGYEVKANALDTAPFNRLVIASAAYTSDLRNAMPHWTAYKLITEVERLFGVAFIFDEAARTATIEFRSAFLQNGAVEAEPVGDQTIEEETGALKLPEAYNIAYNRTQGSETDWSEVVTNEVRNAFATHTFTIGTDGTEQQWRTMIHAKSRKEQLTTIWRLVKDGKAQEYAVERTDTTGGNFSLTFIPIGVFSPITRNAETTEALTLDITPADFHTGEAYPLGNEGGYALIAALKENATDGKKIRYVCAPQAFEKAPTNRTDDQGNAFVSVAEAMQGAETPEAQTDESEGQMRLFFAPQSVFNIESQTHMDAGVNDSRAHFRVPQPYTHHGPRPADTGSLSLHPTQGGDAPGDHIQTIQADTDHRHNITFLWQGRPQPSKIHIIGGKAYIAQKIETEIKDGKAPETATGQFFQLL